MRSSIPHERITNSIIEHAKLTTTYGKPRKASTPSAYYHFKSADWEQNKPFKLASFTAGELAKMPTYYIMDLDKGMAETAAPEMPLAAAIAGCKWLPDKELAVYATEWDRTGFQGGNEGLYARRIRAVISGHRVMSAPGPVPSRFFAGALTILSAVSECRCSTRRHSTNPAGWGYHYATECPSKIRRKRVSRSRRSCTARETRSSSGALQETQV